MSPESTAALRECARICWTNRAKLGLSDREIEHVLLAWHEVGTADEGAAAADALAALRESERQQAKFDELLSGA